MRPPCFVYCTHFLWCYSLYLTRQWDAVRVCGSACRACRSVPEREYAPQFLSHGQYAFPMLDKVLIAQPPEPDGIARGDVPEKQGIALLKRAGK